MSVKVFEIIFFYDCIVLPHIVSQFIAQGLRTMFLIQLIINIAIKNIY